LLLPLSKQSELGFGISYLKSSYLISDDLVANGLVQFSLKENMNILAFPVFFKYTFFTSRLRPYAKVGVIFSRLLSSEMSGIRNGGQTTKINEDVMESRNSKLFHLSFGVGAQYIMKKGYLFIEATYIKGTTDMVDASNRFPNQNLLFSAGYVADNFKINSLAINFGYAFSLFKD